MKKIYIILMMVGMTAGAQVKGNGEVVKKTFDVATINKFELNMYAEVTLDASIESQISIEAESNLIDNIDFEVVEGKLNLQQKEWIQATKPIRIIVGVPDIKNVEVGSHKTLRVIHLNQDQVVLTALIGKIEAEGDVRMVSLNAERGTVDASKLKTEIATLSIWDAGKAIINATEEVNGNIDDDAQVSFVREPKVIARGIKREVEKKSDDLFEDAMYINFKIKNNSWNRNHFVVKGPKKDGSYFGYGFPMMPGTVKKERWTVGTKVYKVNKLGLKKLLITIKAEDAGNTIELF